MRTKLWSKDAKFAAILASAVQTEESLSFHISYRAEARNPWLRRAGEVLFYPTRPPKKAEQVLLSSVTSILEPVLPTSSNSGPVSLSKGCGSI